jgi:hypothetical protein
MRCVALASGLLILFCASPAYAEMKCGAESCGPSTKSQRTIDGVLHNCDFKKCTTSCCSLADPPVCQIKTVNRGDCTPARIVPGNELPNILAPKSNTLQQ